MVTAVIVLGGIAAAAAVALGIASRIFYVEEDPRLRGVVNLLPGANCGGCGFAGCAPCAEAMVRGEAQPNACVVGQTEVATRVAAYLGMKLVDTEPSIACPDCQGGERATRKYEYGGLDDCRAAMLYFHGPLKCNHGCIGLGTCVRTCRFGAITMGPAGLPVFDAGRCLGCGACARACPKGIISIISETTKILHWNRYTECLSPCRQQCPAQINIPRYVEHVKRGEFAAALLTIKEADPLPLCTGRVCPGPCSPACRRHIQDEPVAINYLERFAADREWRGGRRLHIPVAPDTGKRVAVIGSGPAGLSAAYYLRRLGHAVAIFEQMDRLGGMLRYGIPEYRLPKRVLDWEIEGILALGIEATTGVRLGREISVDGLRAAGHDAIFLAVGAWRDLRLGLPGADAAGVYSGLEFMRRFQTDDPIAVAGHVVVIGGGNVAVDAARSALRQGASRVTIVYRRSRDEMPANPAEILAAQEEGIALRFLAAPREIEARDGRVCGLVLETLAFGEPDPDGRRRPLPRAGAVERVPCDAVIEAVGQVTQTDFLAGDGMPALPLTRWATLDANEDTLQTDVPYVFAGGDCFTGPGLMITAVGAGRFAARSIHHYVTRGEIPPIEDLQTGLISESLHDSIAGVAPRPKVHEPVVSLRDRLGTFKEVEGTIDEEDALYEATRCLHCGTYCYDHDLELARLQAAGQAEAGDAHGAP